MLGDLGLYSPTFSPLLLEETGAFYKEEGQRLIESADVPHYLQHCEVRAGSVGAVAFVLCVQGRARTRHTLDYFMHEHMCKRSTLLTTPLHHLLSSCFSHPLNAHTQKTPQKNQTRLQQEQQRCLHYLDPSSRRPLLQEVGRVLLDRALCV